MGITGEASQRVWRQVLLLLRLSIWRMSQEMDKNGLLHRYFLVWKEYIRTFIHLFTYSFIHLFALWWLHKWDFIFLNNIKGLQQFMRPPKNLGIRFKISSSCYYWLMSASWLEPNPPSPPPWINGAVIMKFKFFAARNLGRLLKLWWAGLVSWIGQFRFLGNFPPTPLLSQHYALSGKLVLMLA